MIIVLLDLVPDKLPRAGIHHIDKGLLPIKIKRPKLPVLCAHQHVRLAHRLIVLARRVDRRPDRHNQPDAHLLEFPAHRLWIRPVFRIELPFSLLRPVEKVDDDHIDRDPAPFVLPRRLEQILLALISEPALPETGCPPWKLRCVPRQVAVQFRRLSRRLSRIDEIICLIRTVRHKHRVVFCRLASSGRRIVPEKPVAERRVQHRQCGLGVVVDDLTGAALSVKQIFLLLPHPVKMLTLVCLKDHLDLVVIPLHMPVAVRVIPLKLRAQQLLLFPAVLFIIRDNAAVPWISSLHDRADHAV